MKLKKKKSFKLFFSYLHIYCIGGFMDSFFKIIIYITKSGYRGHYLYISPLKYSTIHPAFLYHTWLSRGTLNACPYPTKTGLSTPITKTYLK